MEGIIERHGVDLCLPISEAELGILYERHIESIGGAPFIGVSHAAIEIGLDKLSTARFIASLDIPVPWTTPADPGVAPDTLPCIFKPRRSAGSKGIFVCHTREDADWYAGKAPNGVFQELLQPANKEITCAVYRSLKGRTAVLPMLRELVGGFTGWAQVIEESEIVTQCTKIAEAMNLHGAINIQLRLTVDGPRIFEINPRYSSTVYLRHLLGFTDLQWAVEEYEGMDIVLTKIAAGATAVRLQGAAVICH
jgi:carbamoyl-phosphate synthase large subunit